MSNDPSADDGLEEAPLTTEGLESSDDFDPDLGDAAKTGHVAPILPPK
jgi:hypothetical protein